MTIDDARARLRYLAGVLLLAAAYYAAGRTSLALQFHGPVAAIWLPVGVGAATLYLGGLRWWPGLVIGDLALADTTQPLGSVLGLTAGNLADIVVIAVLLRKLLGPRSTLARRQDVSGMIAAIAAGAATTATVAVLSLRLGGVIEAPGTWAFWRSWALADASGSLVVIPLVLAWASARSDAWRRRTAWEGALIIAGVVGLSIIALAAELPLSYMVFPPLIWAALRLGQRGATLAVAVASGVAVGITAADLGPFSAHSITDTVLSTQLYIAVAAFTTLYLAAVVSERRQVMIDLADARGRILAAADTERRRIERNLHDGAQQRLVMLGLRLAIADDVFDRDPAAARRIIADLEREVQDTIAELRSLATTVYSPVLSDFGLGEALRALARFAPVTASVDVDGIERCRPAVESAVYFCCAEALQNAAKHAGETTSVAISLHRHHDLRFEIRDDGRGFSPLGVRSGHGLANMRDRIQAVGGTLDIRSDPGRGTTVIGTIAGEFAAVTASHPPSVGARTI